MKKILVLFALLMPCFAFLSCDKDDENPLDGQTYWITMTGFYTNTIEMSFSGNICYLEGQYSRSYAEYSYDKKTGSISTSKPLTLNFGVTSYNVTSIKYKYGNIDITFEDKSGGKKSSTTLIHKQ